MNQQDPYASLSSWLDHPGRRLRQQRLALGLSQEALAEALGVSARSIRRWEQDQAIPQEVARERLRQMFGTDLLLPASSADGERPSSSLTPSFWHIPLPRNPFFTGREEFLRTLHKQLKHEQRLALAQSWALSGLGGIGKTQIALEYAYQHRQDYSAIFWINAATQESVQADLRTMADLLQLPEKDERDQIRVLRAVKQWLATHQDWLLILQQEHYVQAEALCQRALRIQQQALGPEHPEVARSLHTLASIYHASGKYERVEALYQQALHIREHSLGADHPDIAGTLYNLARLSFDQGRYEQAEPLFLRTLRIWEQTFGSEHPDVVYALNALAGLYSAQGKHEQAEPLFLRTLRIWEQTLGPEHPYVAYPLHGLASLYGDQKKYEQAESLHQRALRILEQALGPEHSQVAHPLHGLATLYSKRGMDQQAEALYQRALSIREHALGERHLETAEILHDFAAFQEAQGKDREAVALYQRAHSIREQILGVEHPTTLLTRTAYLAVLERVNQK